MPFVRTSGWLQKWTMQAFTKPCCVNPAVGKQLGEFYEAMDLTTSTQMFIREVTPDLLSTIASAPP